MDYEPRGILQLQEPLEKAGFTTMVAKDGLTGIEAFQRTKPHLTLIEAMLPRKHGFEVCQELKKTPHGRASAIIIVTSVYKGRKYRTQALHNYGCDEYLEKPVDPDKLVEIVTRLVRAKWGATVPVAEPAPAASPAPAPEEKKPQPPTTVPRSDAAEQEISDHLDDLLGSGPQRGTSSEKVVSFDPDRARKRRTDNAVTGPRTGGAVPSVSAGGAGHALDRLAHEPHRAAPAPDAGPIVPELRRETLPRPSALEAPPEPRHFGAWFWVALLVALLTTCAALLMLRG